MRQANRRDTNQSQLVSDLRQAHFTVADTSMVGNGFPDLVIARNQINLLIEVKDTRGQLSPGQHAFALEWKGPVIVAHSIEDILNIFRDELWRRR